MLRTGGWRGKPAATGAAIAAPRRHKVALLMCADAAQIVILRPGSFGPKDLRSFFLCIVKSELGGPFAALRAGSEARFFRWVAQTLPFMSPSLRGRVATLGRIHWRTMYAPPAGLHNCHEGLRPLDNFLYWAAPPRRFAERLCLSVASLSLILFLVRLRLTHSNGDHIG